MTDPRDRYLRSRYGISQAEYEKLLAFNNRGCWICGAPAKTRRLHVDHNHKIRKARESVRGILCSRCNRGLVWFRDQPGLMRIAAQYLENDTAQQILLLALTTSQYAPDNTQRMEGSDVE